ncbi:MAG: LacI family DNA-binding transcriptional regulator [Ignavibacteriaceae bacterium]
MSTIFDVAEKAQVSVITVSRLLNNPKLVSARTAEKITGVMEELNYQPSQIARSLVKKQTNTIGVIMSDIKNTFFNNWFRIVEDYASKHGYNLLLCNTDENPAREMKYVKLLQSQRVDGLIIIPCSEKSVDYLLKSNLNFILVDRILRQQKTSYVSTDHYQGAFEATEYLIKLGHRRIAVLKGGGILFPDIKRYAGFENAMKENKINIEDKFILNCEFDEMKAYNATLKLMSMNPEPTAIFTFNSKMMNGTIKAAQKLGMTIPDDISLICFDQIPGYEIFQPRIGCVIQPVKSLGEKAISALISKIKKPEKSGRTRIILKPELNPGNSCKRLN